LPCAQPTIDQDVAVTTGEEGAVTGAAAPEHGHAEHGRIITGFGRESQTETSNRWCFGAVPYPIPWGAERGRLGARIGAGMAAIGITWWPAKVQASAAELLA
jgi:hypothetical protein